MEREIKFRAWDKKSKKMRLVNSINFGIIDGCECKSEFCTVSLMGRDIIDGEDMLIVREEKEAELMQYTGFKDKNGKEVYEGDILEFEYEGETSLYVVKFEYGQWICEEIELHAQDALNACSSDMIVIGNIYENAELLKETR